MTQGLDSELKVRYGSGELELGWIKNRYVSLFLLAFLPFLIIMLILSPYLSGIHGTTYSNAGNEYLFDGEIEGETPILFGTGNARTQDNVTYEGRFKGDLFINNNTGWVFCNGKVRYSGRLHIKDAELTYKIREELSAECFDLHDFQIITLNGEKGDMEEGFPTIILGLFGSLLGVLIWTSWVLMGFGIKAQRIIIILSFILAMWFTLFSNPISFIAFVCIFIPVLLLFLIAAVLWFRLNLKEKGNIEPILNNPLALQIVVILEVLLFLISLVSFIQPNHSGSGLISGNYYSKRQAMDSVFYGQLGLIASSFLLGTGLWKIRYLIKKENVERSVVMSD